MEINTINKITSAIGMIGVMLFAISGNNFVILAIVGLINFLIVNTVLNHRYNPDYIEKHTFALFGIRIPKNMLYFLMLVVIYIILKILGLYGDVLNFILNT
jgi:hypothetical protein